jgi:GNAT superfamily N-acetyltransferase
MSFDDTLLSRVEDASLNASAPPQQRWLDGWLLRTHPGKARRARCINALAVGRLPLDDKLVLAGAWFTETGSDLIVRITPYTQPASLDSTLAQRGWQHLDPTHVWISLLQPATAGDDSPPPEGLRWQALGADAYAATVGSLRASPPAQQQAHAERLRHSPVPYRGYALIRSDGQVLACGQTALEGTLVGLYDVFTHPEARNQGLSTWLCKRLLTLAAREGGTTAYLQVEAGNHAAQAVYRPLGFAHGYSYHYRQAPDGALASV